MSKKIQTALAKVGQALNALTRAYEREGHMLTPEQHANAFGHIAAGVESTRVRCDAARTLSKMGSAFSFDVTPATVVTEMPNPQSPTKPRGPWPAKTPAAGLKPIGRMTGSKEVVFDTPDKSIDVVGDQGDGADFISES